MKNLLGLILLALCLVNEATAQKMPSVAEMMREPSIAGMRAESARISPDGKFVIFSWNAEGKEPRNLYIIPTNGGEPRILVNAEQNFEPRTPAPESKLNYGLQVRDDFSKAREKNLFGADISPDSKRLLFSQNTDIYLLDLVQTIEMSHSVKNNLENVWRQYEQSSMRRADLVSLIVTSVKLSGVQEQDLFEELETSRQRLLATLKHSSNDISTKQRQEVIDANFVFAKYSSRLVALSESFPPLRANEKLRPILDRYNEATSQLNSLRTEYESIAVNFSNSTPRRLTRTQGFEAAARWLDNDRILFQSDGNYFVLNTKEAALIQVTREANPAQFQTIQGIAPSENGEFVAYSVSDGARQKPLNVPNYLGEFVVSPTFRRGFTEQKVYVAKTDGSLEKAFEIQLPKSEGAGYIRRLEWTTDASALIVDRIDKDTKRRQLFQVTNIGTKEEKAILITEETDEKWIGSLSRLLEVNPRDASEVIFGSEKDGFNHLYLAKLNAPNAPQITQLTSGKFEIEWARWTKDGQIIFSSTEENTAERQFYALDLVNRQKTKLPTGANGMRNSPQLSKNGEQTFLLYELSNWNKPSELFAVKICKNCANPETPRQLTKTTPDTFLQRSWNAPKFIDVPSRDGKAIKVKVYTPAKFNKKRKYPAVFFVHGAGYLQNTINGWNNYYREFMFNQLLTEKGYVVLDIDYRGSAGYGRDWRTDVHDFLGGKDLEDHLDAIDYAVRYYGVNPQKIGVYGGSYGGFMAGMMILRAPDKVAAAAALRPVFDWKNYFYSSPVYTTERLGFPDKNPEAYKRSSPISYAENLRKPFLILHGLVDDNVPAQDSIQMTEKLMRLEKTPYFDAMLYPSENHGFTRPSSWTDEYTRILDLFERHLK